MKKIFVLLTLCVLLALSGCGSALPVVEEAEVKEAVETVSPEPVQETIDPFYEKMQSDMRPIAVMIDNDDNNARPQIGLESAYVVYEIIVEGNSTRYMALFKEHDLEKVGPIRSSRHYFLDYVMENDAIYTHCGWSPRASRDIPALGINNINGINGADGKNFWRDYTYNNTWHNLYSSLVKLHNYAENTKQYRLTTERRLLHYNKTDTVPEAGEAVTSVFIPYKNAYQVRFTYDPEEKVFVKTINGNTYKSQSGDLISAKNILIYTVSNYTLNDGDNKGRQELENIGSGSGYYLTDGKAVPITWTKASRSEQTKYTYDDGTEVVVNPGNTFIQIVPRACGFTME